MLNNPFIGDLVKDAFAAKKKILETNTLANGKPYSYKQGSNHFVWNFQDGNYELVDAEVYAERTRGIKKPNNHMLLFIVGLLLIVGLLKRR